MGYSQNFVLRLCSAIPVSVFFLSDLCVSFFIRVEWCTCSCLFPVSIFFGFVFRRVLLFRLRIVPDFPFLGRTIPKIIAIMVLHVIHSAQK
jgi:hypothetical protein